MCVRGVIATLIEMGMTIACLIYHCAVLGSNVTASASVRCAKFPLPFHTQPFAIPRLALSLGFARWEFGFCNIPTWTSGWPQKTDCSLRFWGLHSGRRIL